MAANPQNIVLAEEDIVLTSKMKGSGTLPSTPVAPPKKRRGRPRKNEQAGIAQSRTILDTAISLFARNGYQATTMSQIAEAAGYSQSSLYYWFKRKEDLLAAIVEETGFSLQVATRIAQLPDEKPAQLYAVLYSDMLMMCNLPCDFYDLEDVAHSQESVFGSFFITYQQLSDAVRQIIEQGVERSEFICQNPAIAAINALAANEGLQHRYHVNLRFPADGTRMIDEAAMQVFRTPENLAHHAASTTIKNLAPNCVPAELAQQARDNNWI